MSLKDQREISQWAVETFGDASSNMRVAVRANEEMSELLRHLSTNDNHPEAGAEIADIVIVLYRLADRMGLSLHHEVEIKMEINRTRTWSMDGDGHGHHIRRKTQAVITDTQQGLNALIDELGKAPKEITENPCKSVIFPPNTLR